MNSFTFCISGDIQQLYETNLKPGHAAAFSDDCDSASAKGIVRGAGNQVGYSAGANNIQFCLKNKQTKKTSLFLFSYS